VDLLTICCLLVIEAKFSIMSINSDFSEKSAKFKF